MKSDQQLVKELKANNQNAMGQLHTRYFEKVYNRCLSITKCESDAYDCANDALLISFEKIDTFQQSASYSTWLYAIATNYTISYCKKLKKTHPINASVLEAEFIREDYDVLPQHDLSEILEKILNSIAEKEKELLIEKYSHRKSIEELQEKYGSGTSAIKMRLMRAKQKVQELYMKEIALSA